MGKAQSKLPVLFRCTGGQATSGTQTEKSPSESDRLLSPDLSFNTDRCHRMTRGTGNVGFLSRAELIGRRFATQALAISGFVEEPFFVGQLVTNEKTIIRSFLFWRHRVMHPTALWAGQKAPIQ